MADHAPLHGEACIKDSPLALGSPCLVSRIDLVRARSMLACAGFGRLSGSRHQDRGAVCAGRRHRCGGADAGAGDGKRSRRVRHHREQAGGGDHSRHPDGRGQSARRLHAADGDVCQRRQSQPECEAALRCAQGFCRGGAAGALLQHRRGQSGVADQIDCGPDRGGKGRARASSPMAPTAPVLRRIWPANCSSTWPRSI